MKKIFFILILFTSIIYSQGLNRSPFDTVGWDPAWGTTEYFKFYIFDLYSHPGGRENINIRRIDSVMNALIVLLDLKQFQNRNDTLIWSDSASFILNFDSTDVTDTVDVPGIDSLDVVLITARGDPAGYLWAAILPDKVVVHREVGTTANLKYNFAWIRKYAP